MLLRYSLRLKEVFMHTYVVAVLVSLPQLLTKLINYVTPCEINKKMFNSFLNFLLYQ